MATTSCAEGILEYSKSIKVELFLETVVVMLRKRRYRNSFIRVVNKGQYPGDLFCSCMNFIDQEWYPHEPVPHALPSGPITYCQVGFAGWAHRNSPELCAWSWIIEVKDGNRYHCLSNETHNGVWCCQWGGQRRDKHGRWYWRLGTRNERMRFDSLRGKSRNVGSWGIDGDIPMWPEGPSWMSLIGNAWSYGFDINGTLCVWNLIWSRGRYMTFVMSCGMVSSCLFEPYMTLNELCHSLFFYKGCTIIYVVC